MRAVAAWIILLFVAAAAGYFASFYGTRSVLGHGAHCGVGGNPACNTSDSVWRRYYAGQIGDVGQAGGYSHGIKGYLRAQDIALRDTVCERPRTSNPGCDFILDSLTMVRQAQPLEWVQIGFREGMWFDWSTRSSPKVYTEYQTGCTGYGWVERYVSGFHHSMQLHWDGQWSYCNGVPVYFYWFSLDGSSIDANFMGQALNNFQALTEHFDNTHMEPNGLSASARPQTAPAARRPAWATTSPCGTRTAIYGRYGPALAPRR